MGSMDINDPSEKLRKRLLEQELKLRKKQPEHWAKTKYRKYAKPYTEQELEKIKENEKKRVSTEKKAGKTKAKKPEKKNSKSKSKKPIKKRNNTKTKKKNNKPKGNKKLNQKNDSKKQFSRINSQVIHKVYETNFMSTLSLHFSFRF